MRVNGSDVMPTYDYKCSECGKTFDVFQSITAKPFRRYECPSCGKVQTVSRLIGTGGGIIFKGSGFYQTDYRSKQYHKAAKAERESAGTTASGNGSNKGAGSSDTSSAPAKSKKEKPVTSKPPAKAGAA